MFLLNISNHFPFLDQLARKAKLGYSLYDTETSVLHYGKFLELILSQTSKAFKELDRDGKLPANIKIGIHNDDFDPCIDCKEQQDAANRHNPVTHCVNCVPVVTHTKQGICVLVRHKEKKKTLIMDLIPVLPAPPTGSLMSFYALIITSLMREKPPGWKRAFMAYFTKDKVIPEEMEELMHEEDGEGEKKRYILVKLLSHGPEPNYQIRPTQSIDAISKLTSEHADCLAYQFAKTLVKLLGIEGIGSYLLKKAFLTATNYIRETVAIKKEGEHENTGLLLLLMSPEFVNIFVRKIDPSYNEKIVKEGIITLKSNK